MFLQEIAVAKRKVPTFIRIRNLLLESGVRQSIRFDSPNAVRFVYEYRYVAEKETDERVRLQQPQMVNDYQLIVDYTDGVLSGCSLSMHVIIPSRLGKHFVGGLDISPGAKTYIEFVYRVGDNLLKMESVQVGAQPKVVLEEFASRMPMRQTNFPFPLLDEVPYELGQFSIPFLHNCGEARYFDFVSTIKG